MCEGGRVSELRKAHRRRRIQEEGASRGRQRRGEGREESKDRKKDEHNLLITMCEIRCVTKSANNTRAHTTSTYHGNVAPDQETFKHQ